MTNPNCIHVLFSYWTFEKEKHPIKGQLSVPAADIVLNDPCTAQLSDNWKKKECPIKNPSHEHELSDV